MEIEIDDFGVATLRLNRPKMNALSAELLTQLKEAVTELAADPPRAVVVWGGERIFAAGAEISEFGGPEEAKRIGGLFHGALNALAELPRVTIAAVNGYALGGGCELALACDLRVAADNAKFGQPEILLGIIPGGGGTQRLPRLIGSSRAKDLILSGRQVGAEEALSIGLVNRVVPGPEVYSHALEWAREFARGPATVQGLAKVVLDKGLDLSIADGLQGELRAFEEAFTTEDSAIGVKSFFENGPGKAQFQGR